MPDLEKIKQLRDELKTALQKDDDTAPWMNHNGKGDRFLRVVDRYTDFITPLLRPERKVTWDERNKLIRMIRKIENRWYAFNNKAKKSKKIRQTEARATGKSAYDAIFGTL